LSEPLKIFPPFFRFPGFTIFNVSNFNVPGDVPHIYPIITVKQPESKQLLQFGFICRNDFSLLFKAEK